MLITMVLHYTEAGLRLGPCPLTDCIHRLTI